jgi:hypothetical protein
MAQFDPGTLSKLHDRKEVAIRTTKHPESAITIWVVVSDADVFVRSVRGANGRWYRDLAKGGPATLGPEPWQPLQSAGDRGLNV